MAIRLPRAARLAAALCLAAASLPGIANASPARPDPLWTHLVPAPQQVGAAAGPGWSPSGRTRIVVDPAARDRLSDEAGLLAGELASTGLTPARPRIVTAGAHAVRPGDIWLALGDPAGGSPERYALDVGGSARIVGATDTGVFYGTRTLLQAATLAGGPRAVPAAHVLDAPLRGNRTVMVDNGRKYFSPGWLRDLVRAMAWQKNNTLELHFSESTGFRIASDRHPEVVSRDGALTKDEVRQLITFAKRYHVEVVPALDSPGHLGQALAAHPELQVRLSDGTVSKGDLDYSNPAARKLIGELVDEYADLFGGRYFHIGGDEFAALHDPAKVPQLLGYARAEVGASADVYDGYDHYQNELVDLLARKGKTAIAYNNSWRVEPRLEPLDKSVIVDFWARQSPEWPRVRDWLDAGYLVRNMDENLLYYVIAKRFQDAETGKTRTPGWLFERWRPERYLRTSFTQELEYDEVPRQTPGQFGSVLAIWSDDAAFQTEQQVRDRFAPWLGGYSARNWGSPVRANTYADFLASYRLLAPPPS
ncbi:family 20 glycosylhydrolase [Amycolatopsis sp. CA-230715]|uniref:family 20 glycosylhydrolase n=1 Tax=Amycolatopsis sp. CA-230715 TaxID=2745196 RepID=UPI001C02DEB0|nr:family 20 glycosylhydrolase [Amycolatopsis sp. CA-230715]QWF77765.1 hypothetical protein HUW46_01157 [Amycolatopsis sp. CA-230715]